MIEEFNDGLGKYIRIQGDDIDRISDNILEHNLVNSILPMQLQWVNGHKEYIFEITGYTALEDLLVEKSLEYDLMVNILKNMITASKELGEYLLGSEHLVIETDSIFIGENNDIRFVYTPEVDYDLGTGLNKFAEQLLKSADGNDSRASALIYRLHKFSLASDVTWTKFRKFIEKEQPDIKKEIDNISYNTSEQPKENKKNKVEKKTVKPTITNPIGKLTGSMILPASILSIGILIPVILFRMGVFEESLSGRTDVVMTVSAFVFFIIVAAYGAWRVCPRKNKEVIYDKENSLNVCLVPSVRGQKLIPITGFPWKIGKDAKKVDAVLSGNGISDIHSHLRR